MKQNKLALYISKYDIQESEVGYLNKFGILDINPINITIKGATRAIFSHEPEDVIIIYGLDFDRNLLDVLRDEEYEMISYDRIRGLVESTEQIYKMFEGKDEKTEEDQFI